MNENDQEKTYSGLLGLDNISPFIKNINFITTVIVGAGIVWNSTTHPVSSPTISYEYWHLSAPLIFTYGLPVGLSILWLRLTGLKWHWGLLAGILILILPFLALFIFTFVARVIFPT